MLTYPINYHYKLQSDILSIQHYALIKLLHIQVITLTVSITMHRIIYYNSENYVISGWCVPTKTTL